MKDRKKERERVFSSSSSSSSTFFFFFFWDREREREERESSLSLWLIHWPSKWITWRGETFSWSNHHWITREIPTNLWNSNIHYHIHNSKLRVWILTWINQLYTSQPLSLRSIYWYPPSSRKSSKKILFLWLPDQNLLCFLSLTHGCPFRPSTS